MRAVFLWSTLPVMVGGLVLAVVLLVGRSSRADGDGKDGCTFKGIKLFGNVKRVDAFPDLKIKVVDAFADLHVKVVDAFPDACGRWKWVDAFPDFTVQFVDAFPDVTIKYVDAFPGRP